MPAFARKTSAGPHPSATGCVSEGASLEVMAVPEHYNVDELSVLRNQGAYATAAAPAWTCWGGGRPRAPAPSASTTSGSGARREEETSAADLGRSRTACHPSTPLLPISSNVPPDMVIDEAQWEKLRPFYTWACSQLEKPLPEGRFLRLHTCSSTFVLCLAVKNLVSRLLEDSYWPSDEAFAVLINALKRYQVTEAGVERLVYRSSVASSEQIADMVCGGGSRRRKRRVAKARSAIATWASLPIPPRRKMLSRRAKEVAEGKCLAMLTCDRVLRTAALDALPNESAAGLRLFFSPLSAARRSRVANAVS